MLSIISPSKSQNFLHATIGTPVTQPYFTKKTHHLLQICKDLSKNQIKQLMKVSDKIAALNYERFQSFDNQVSKQAIFAYTGDVYQNIDKQNFSQEQINFLQDHLLIISGLYGILKPLDFIKPYRLEMSVTLPSLEKLANFWQDHVTTYINQILVTHSSKYLINLASNEYAIAINQHHLQYPIINIHFKEERNNKLQVIGINAKKARGKMINYITKHLIDTPEKLQKFTELNYQFHKSQSSEQDWVFIKVN